MVEAEQHIDMQGDDNEEVDEKQDEKEFGNISEDLRAKFEETFKIFEKDNNETMETQTLGTILRWLGFNPTEEELLKYKQDYDPRGDEIIKKRDILKIINQKVLEPDTLDEFIEAAKLFDHDADGKIEVSELRWAMTQLGNLDRMTD